MVDGISWFGRRRGQSRSRPEKLSEVKGHHKTVLSRQPNHFPSRKSNVLLKRTETSLMRRIKPASSSFLVPGFREPAGPDARPCGARPFGPRTESRRTVNPRFPGADAQAPRAKFRPGCPKFCRPVIGELLAPGWPDRKARLKGAFYAGCAVSGSVGVWF